MKKNRWQKPLVIIAAFAALLAVNALNSIQTPNEKVKSLIDSHRAALVMVKSYTDRDNQFLGLLKNARRRLRGKAGIVITDKKSGYHVGHIEKDDELPVLLIFDSHGNIISLFKKSVDTKLFEETVEMITAHPHSH